MKPSKPKTAHQELPNDILITFEYTLHSRSDRYLYAAALHMRGWTQTALAPAVGVSREAVRQQISKISPGDAIKFVVANDLPVPLPPPLHEPAPGPAYVEPTPETLQRLLELKPLAEQVRSNSPRFREQAEEYTWLINYAHTVEGVTLYRLAKRLGCTHGALRFRLARYGYKLPSTGSSRVYNSIKTENRVKLEEE